MIKKNINEEKNQYIVGIGASAGGLEAIESFFVNMPADSGLAFVVIQHLSPDYKSLMVELLSKRTPMRVLRAEEGMIVESGSVYLIPPKKNLTIFHGKLLLSDQDHTRGLNLPIDVFFRSLADDQGDKAVGIILSGTGSDGMRGIRAIKEQGGMVMVQDEESAKFDGMPRSAISTGLVDFIIPPEEMPRELISFIKHPYVTRSKQADRLATDEDNMTRIFALLRERHKIDFTYYKMSTVIRRIERRMSVNQIDKLNEFVRFLEANPREVTTLYRELLIGVTNFFRDPEAFEELSTKWIPELFSRKKGQDIRLWIPGCSTGEEAYSMAILCKETLESMGRSLDVKIFATDVDQDAVMFAGSGIYPESIAADICPKYLSKYFFRRDNGFQIARTIREMVVFAHHNLIKDPPFTNIDLISCRNLLIYLQPVLQRKALDFFNFSLAPGGILFLGSSESVGDMLDHFDPLHHKWKIYRSRGRRRQPGGSEIPAVISGRTRLMHTLGSTQRASRVHEEERVLERFLKGLEGDYVPLAMVVNEQMELLHLLGDSSGLLKLPSGKVMNDITRMVSKDLAIPMATGLQKVFKTQKEVKYTNIKLTLMDDPRTIQMRIKPLPAKKGQEPLAAVFIDEIKRESADAAEESISYDVGRETHQRILDIEQELQFTRENLQATIEELETSNEELQATNEELLASNEELQSTNEELQSVNEELHTVNAEHQAKIIELTELNNDIENLMASTQIGTLFLDENLEIRKFTPQMDRVISIISKDIGRPIKDLTHRLKGMDLNALIRQVQETAAPLERDVQTLNGEWFLMRVLPYYIGPKTFSGVLLIFIDVGQMKNVQDQLQKSIEDYDTLFSSMLDGFALHEMIFENGNPADFRFLSVNPAFEQLTGLKKEQIIGKTVLEVMPETEAYWIKNYGKVVKTGRPSQFENYSKALDKYFTVRAYRPAPGRFATVFTDITEKKKAEQVLRQTNRELEKNQAWLKAAASMAHIGAWEIDLKTYKTFWTEEVYRIYEVPPDFDHNVEGGIQFYHPDDRPRIEKAVKNTMEKGKSFDIECRFISGRKKWKWVRAIGKAEMKDNTIIRVYGAFQDITSIKKTETALEHSHAELENVYHASPLGMGVLVNRVIQNANDSLAELTGYQKEELIGKSAALLYRTEKEYERAGREKYAQIEEKDMAAIYAVWKTKTGGLLNVFISAVPIDPEDLSYGVTFSVQPVSNRKEG